MTRSVEARRAGEAMAASAGDLARLWRATRMQARSDVWPALLDGVMDDFFARAGEALAQGRDPALVWPALAGTVRLDPRDEDRSRAEIDAEWEIAERVLLSACEALAGGEEAREWIGRALVLARAGARSLHEGGGPRSIAVVWWLSGLGAPGPLALRAGRS